MKWMSRLLFPVILALICFPIWGKIAFGRFQAHYYNGDAQELNELFTSAWTHGKADPESTIKKHVQHAEGVILAFYSEEKHSKSPIMAAEAIKGDDTETLAALIAKAESKYENIKDFHVGPMSVHLILDVSKVHLPIFDSLFSRYQMGLTGLIYCENQDCRAFPAPLIHARGLKYEAAVKALKHGKGALVEGMDRSDGVYLFKDFGIIMSDDEQLPLYRASVPVRNPTSTQIIDACRIAGDFLVRTQRATGRWYYEYYASRDRSNKKAYNILRHAGTTYSLFQLYGVISEKRYANAATRGLRYLEKSIEADPVDDKRLFVREGKHIKLGGAGLGLMAYVEKEKVLGTTAGEKKTMEGLARHLMLSQKADGSFHSYHALPGKTAKKRRSIYYPGEAMVGLIRYHQIRPERKDCLEAVIKAANYLIQKRWNMLGIRFNIPPDAWLMLALEELHEVTGDRVYAKYCFEIAKGMKFDQWISIYPQYDYYGGFFPVAPQITPAGARSEGLTAAWLIAQRMGDQNMIEGLTATIRRSAGFQLSGLIRKPFAALYKNPKRALGVFRHNATSNRTRIDYNQHNISGLLIAAKIVDS
jgi:hypothetical protein